MNKGDIDLLMEQIRALIFNKPITGNMKSTSEELADLQEAVSYLSDCLTESNEFLRHLRMGELDVKPPSRHNFLAGNLKELHSALRHLTWQANQVAHGDYSQSVSFLGDFSVSFNQMIGQLAERESQLKVQSELLTETLEMMVEGGPSASGREFYGGVVHSHIGRVYDFVALPVLQHPVLVYA